MVFTNFDESEIMGPYKEIKKDKVNPTSSEYQKPIQQHQQSSYNKSDQNKEEEEEEEEEENPECLLAWVTQTGSKSNGSRGKV
ncbi:hypothetical protein M0802_012075 [Mischocyttarus mexicanus]|nr:hypothetical protein M0802_012075 [Mischocyttarus mexicanus]